MKNLIKSLLIAVTTLTFVFCTSHSNAQVMIKDIINTGAGTYLSNLTNVNGTLFFVNNDTYGVLELWKSDGTTAGTVMVKSVFCGDLINVNGTLYFLVNQHKLWKSDGTAAGTVMVKDINFSDGIFYLTAVNDTLFFSANDGTGYYVLWKSDGTTAGTVTVKDINSGKTISVPSPDFWTPQLINGNGTLYFTGGGGLWKSYGTGAVMIKGGLSLVRNLTNVNDTLYFDAYDNLFGTEPWKSDGTAAGTIMVKDINPGKASSNTNGFTSVNGIVYFIEHDLNNYNNSKLWKSDGTTAGTVIVSSVGAQELINFNGTLYFASPGKGLWKSDGTTAGTVMVKNIYPYNMLNVNGTLYFRSDSGLWKSDGTTAGTVMVKNIALSNLTNVNGTLYFTVNDRELWKYDTTTGISEVGTTGANIVIYPNPAKDKTIIEYTLPQGSSKGELVVYNLQGQELKRVAVGSSSGKVEFNSGELQAGTYIYQLKGESFLMRKKMVVVK